MQKFWGACKELHPIFVIRYIHTARDSCPVRGRDLQIYVGKMHRVLKNSNRRRFLEGPGKNIFLNIFKYFNGTSQVQFLLILAKI